MSEATATKPGYILPFWFKQRQCKAEAQGDTMIKVSGPNLGEAYLHVASTEKGWKAGVRLTAEGADVALSDAAGSDLRSAWDVAFELYRNRFIV